MFRNIGVCHGVIKWRMLVMMALLLGVDVGNVGGGLCVGRIGLSGLFAMANEIL